MPKSERNQISLREKVFILNWALVGETERKKCKKLQFSAWNNHGSDRSGKGRALRLPSPRPGGKSGVPPSQAGKH